jgi:hypothetical protein
MEFATQLYYDGAVIALLLKKVMMFAHTMEPGSFSDEFAKQLIDLKYGRLYTKLSDNK